MEPSRELWSLMEPPRQRMVPIWYPFGSHFPGNSLIRQLSREMDQMDQMMSGTFSALRPNFGNISQGRELQVKHDNKLFEVNVGVSNYLPEEIQVKVNDQDRTLVISAKHEEKRDDHGFIARQFTRKIYIPENVEAESVESMLTRDGNLVVRAKVKAIEGAEAGERVINIQREEPKPIKE